MAEPNARPRQPEQGRAVQLPEGGFEHPFQDARYYTGLSQGKEHPRTVSTSSLSATVDFRHRYTRLSNYECVRSLTILEKMLVGGRG